VTRFDHLIGLWEDGAARVRDADPPLRRVLERVIAELMVELRRRVGVTFTAQDLADYYIENGTDWCFEFAYRSAPSDPEAWDVSMVAGAAFARFVHGAMDYGGGVRKELDPDRELPA
jgi:hypothetical protein